MERPSPNDTVSDEAPNLFCLECEIYVGNEPLCPICEEETVDRERLPEKTDAAGFSPIGSDIAGFHVLDIISRDASSLLCRARQRSLGREVALKVFPMSDQLIPEFRGILSTARKVSRIDHVAIGRVYKAGRVGRLLFVARQRLKGTPLAERLGRGALGPHEAIDTAARIATALGIAHKGGVVHGNLKPGNIFVGDGGQVTLTDFGCTVESMTELSPTSGHLYWSPERWLAREVDHRADLYALGALFYSMLCGRPPFQEEDARKLMYAHTNTAPTNPKRLRPELPDELGSIILKLLEKDLNDRYQTADALIDDLRRLRRGEGVRAHVERQDPVVCRFCESANPADAEMCRVCKEPLKGTEVMLALTQRDDEFQCRLCEHYVKKGSAACPTCMNPTCVQCKAATAEASGVCRSCVRPPEGRSLWGKITDIFRRKGSSES